MLKTSTDIKSFRSHYGPGVDSAQNRNYFQEDILGGKGVRLTTLPPSCAVVMKSGNLNFLEPSGPFQARDCFTFFSTFCLSWMTHFQITHRGTSIYFIDTEIKQRIFTLFLLLLVACNVPMFSLGNITWTTQTPQRYSGMTTLSGLPVTIRNQTVRAHFKWRLKLLFA